MLETKPIHALFGAEVRGLDLRRPLADQTFAAVRQAFDRHSLLVFPDQPLTDAQQIAFSRRFGPLEDTRKGEFGTGTEIVVLTNVGADGALTPPGHRQVLSSRANQLWHTDSSFKPVPALASLLSAREIPSAGGETEYASTRAAYAELAPETRRRIDGRVAEHRFVHSRDQIDPHFLTQEERDEFPPVLRPLVRTHPPSGEPALYLASHAVCVSGMPLAEGRALLAELIEFATQPRFVYRHRWRPGDLVMWDNRCTLHRGRPWDYRQHRRTMVRTTVSEGAPSTTAQRGPT